MLAMPDTKIAIDTLQAKARELVVDRDATRRWILEQAVYHTQLDRDIAGCLAGARALGAEIDVSSPVSIPQQKQVWLQQLLQNLTHLTNIHATLKAELGIEDDGSDPDADDSRPEMPRIADIILERLQEAREGGAKAADIRRYIYRTYRSDIHEKTVGMTLNRMQTAGQVRRDGRTWYLVAYAPAPAVASEAVNPAEATKETASSAKSAA